MGRKRTFEEEEVLRTVRDLFWDSGYEGTSTYDLMDGTGLGKGSIYQAFGNKHSLYMRIFSDYCRQLVQQARAALEDTSLPPKERIEHYLVFLAREFAAQSPRRGCFLTKATADLAHLDEEVATVARRTYDDIASVFESVLQEAHDGDPAAGEIDQRPTAFLLVAVIRGMDCLSRSGVAADVLVATARSAVATLPGSVPA
jgi:AcrR family transcriptional regulator